MSYTGHVREGVVVFDGPARPPEGAIVHIEEVSAAKDEVPTWGEVFKGLIGTVDGLPDDMADNHYHYVHGSPKR